MADVREPQSGVGAGGSLVSTKPRAGFITRIIPRIERGFEYFSQIFVGALMIIGTVNIVGRFVFNYQIPGSIESSTAALVFVVYLGLAYTQSQHGHVRVEFLVKRAKGKRRVILEIIGLSLALGLSSIMFWQTSLTGLASYHLQEYEPGILNFPIWPGKLIIPLGILLLCVRLVLQIIEQVNLIRSPVDELSKREAA